MYCRLAPDRPAGAGHGQGWRLRSRLQGGAKARLPRLQARKGGTDFAEFICGAEALHRILLLRRCWARMGPERLIIGCDTASGGKFFNGHSASGFLQSVGRSGRRLGSVPELAAMPCPNLPQPIRFGMAMRWGVALSDQMWQDKRDAI